MPPFYRRIVESRVEVAGAHRTGSVRSIGSETEKWGKVIKFAGIKADCPRALIHRLILILPVRLAQRCLENLAAA